MAGVTRPTTGLGPGKTLGPSSRCQGLRGSRGARQPALSQGHPPSRLPKTTSGLLSQHLQWWGCSGRLHPRPCPQVPVASGGTGCWGHCHVLPPQPSWPRALVCCLAPQGFAVPQHGCRSSAGLAVAPAGAGRWPGAQRPPCPGWRLSLPQHCSLRQGRWGSQREAPVSSSDASRKD